MANENDRRNMMAGMAEAVKEVFGDVPLEFTPNGVRFPLGMFGDKASSGVERPGAEAIKRYLEDERLGDAFLAKRGTDKLSRSVRANVLRGRADKLVKGGRFAEAARIYFSAAEILADGSIPTKELFSKVYMEMDKMWGAVDLMECLSSGAAASLKAKNFASALLWAGENIHIMNDIRVSMTKDKPYYDWMMFNLQSIQFFRAVFNTWQVLADIYLELGNTGGAVYYQWQAEVIFSSIPASLKTKETDRLLQSSIQKLHKISMYRHPEPSLVTKLNVIDDKLHIHGSWKKMELKHPGGVTSRKGGGVFIHDGYLYIVGGEKIPNGPYYRDFWRLDLSKKEKWESLPVCPIPTSYLDALTGFSIAVSSDEKAYYFTGSLNLIYFDLRKQEWAYLKTSYKPDSVERTKWPYPYKTGLKECAMHCVDDKLYVFGGSHANSVLGCNLFLVLDLATKEWTRLSGEAVPKSTADPYVPGPRINPCSWVSKDQTKIYIMYGDADRMAAQIHEEPHGATSSYAYDDLWSWDIGRGKWTKEKILGNPPSPRTEMSSVYNPVLNQVVTFGGYCPSAPTFIPQTNDAFRFSYYADTFIAAPSLNSDPSSNPSANVPLKWRQILTRGFPTYRAQAHLIVDPRTGRTYLFAGYTNTEFVPSRTKSFSRAFADLWELRVDLPGGFFQSVDLVEEARTAKVGPWQRCFACGSAGPWKKCGGACKGRAFFCSPQCLKEGWKEHKQIHRCYKVS